MNGPFKLNSFKEASNRELLFWYERKSHTLILRYQVDPADIRWPTPKSNERAYELWKHTCFELFLKEPKSQDYIELNFSPSGQWDCYIFDSYRSPQPPKRYSECQVKFLKQELGIIEVEVKLEEMPTLLIGNATAVITDSTQTNYFAYQHAKDKADFHDQSALVIEFD